MQLFIGFHPVQTTGHISLVRVHILYTLVYELGVILGGHPATPTEQFGTSTP